MGDIGVSLLAKDDIAWLESEFIARWPWPRHTGFIATAFESCTYFVARDADGRYLGHCHIREARNSLFLERGIPEIADLNVMPDSRRRGGATTLLDAAEAHVAAASHEVGIGVGIYADDDLVLYLTKRLR